MNARDRVLGLLRDRTDLLPDGRVRLAEDILTAVTIERAAVVDVLLRWAGRDGSLDTEAELRAAADEMAGEVLDALRSESPPPERPQ